MNKTEYLLSMLMKLPPNFTEIEKELQNNVYTADEVTLAACELAEKCFCESRDFEEYHGRTPKDEELHSPYVYPACELLLKYGLNPNLVLDDEYGQTNIIYELRYVEYKYTAAQTTRLLLENGGSVHIVVDYDCVFRNLDFDVMFDVVELSDKKMFDAEFRLWLLMIGYGATIKDGEYPLNVKQGYDISRFRQFENYSYKIEFLKKGWIMHIYDETGEEVANV